MGIRIEKRIGYGFILDDDLRQKINWDVVHDEEESLYEMTQEEFRARVDAWRNQQEGWDTHNIWYMPSNFSFGDCVHSLGAEDSLAEDVFMLITPDLYADSYRRDDTIDYTEFMLTHPAGESPAGNVQMLPKPPYPHDFLLVEKGNLKPIRNSEAVKAKMGSRTLYLPDELILDGTNFSTVDELLEGTDLLPPAQVILTAVALGVFHEVETAFQLKPMLVTSWG